MRIAGLFILLPLLALVRPGPLRAEERMNITVGDADLKDLLRAASADTDLNLIFEPGLDTHVQGLTLKATTLDEILDGVLPRLGLHCVRQGRNLYIQKTGSEFRFYHVDQLAMARNGSKSFQVNGSSQGMQGQGSAGGATGAGGSSSAYTSSLQMGQNLDPWADLETGLRLLVFGATAAAAPSQTTAAPGSRSYASDGRTLLIQPNQGLVGVGADAATQALVAAYLQETRQRAQRQVLLEARIVEVNLDNDSQLGVDWNGLLNGGVNPAGSFFHTGPTLDSNVNASQGLLQLVARQGRVQATLLALARDNRLKVLSSPRLSTLNNQKAILRVVTEQAYALPSSQITPGTAAGGAVATSQSSPLIVPVGIVLDIQPEIGDDGIITLEVSPSISELNSEKPFPAPGSGGASFTLPVIDRRDLDAVVRVASGETMVLAGIIITKESDDNRGVPWLRTIPLLGSLFSKSEKIRSRTELAIFITPTLMDDGAQVEAVRQGAELGLGAAEKAQPNGRNLPGRP
jgi:MSHA type pilus biogenesis protein MshL